MERRRTFSREFKLEAVKLVTERGVAVAQAAKDLDVHENVLRKWVRELRDEPHEAFPGNGKQKAQDAEIARLRKEVVLGICSRYAKRCQRAANGLLTVASCS